MELDASYIYADDTEPYLLLEKKLVASILVLLASCLDAIVVWLGRM